MTMERAFDEYVKEIDEMIENKFNMNDSNFKSFIEQPYSIIINIFNNKYSHLPEKWRTDIMNHINEILSIKVKDYHINNFTRKTNIENIRTFSGESKIVELRAMVCHLLKKVENLESSNKQILTELENQKTINEVMSSELHTLHKSFDTFKKVGSDPTDDVRIIQRYWRRYLLIKNVKKYAKQYEENLLIEFRKNLLSYSKPNNKPFEAAQRRINPLPKKLKPGSSDPKDWTDRKAAQVARDWLN